MRSIESLIASLRRKQVLLWVDDSGLNVDAPKGSLSSEDIEELRLQKPTLVNFLRKVAVGEGVVAIGRADRGSALPLSFAQQRLWFMDQLEGASAAYHISSAVRLHGVLDEGALEAAFATVVERHEVLRTVFASTGGQPVQVIDAAQRFALRRDDLSVLPRAESERQVKRMAAQEAAAEFDLSAGPLIAARLIKLSAREHALVITMHHVVADGWSMGILIREVGALYKAYQQGKEATLAPLPIQYADYAVWQREWLQGEVLQREVEYWKGRLGQAKLLELPLDRGRPARRSYRGAVQGFALSAALSERLGEIAQQGEATLYMALLAGFQVLLSRVSGQRDVVVASPIAGRSRQETEGLIGFFVNLLLLRVEISAGLTYRQVLGRVKEAALGAYAHQELPYDQLIAELHADRAGSAGGLARVAFTLQNAPQERIELPGLAIELLGQGTVTAKNDLLLTLRESSAGLQGTMEYATDLFEAQTIQALSRRFVRLLEQVTQRPDEVLEEIDLSLPWAEESRGAVQRLSPNQQVMWVDLTVHPYKASYYNIVEYLEIVGEIDPRVLEQAIQRVVDHTAALRLTFHKDEAGLLRQEILATRRVGLGLHDLSQAADPVRAAQGWFESHRHRRIDPVHEVPVRFALLKLGPQRFYWYAHYHHLIIDGVGQVLFRERVARCYRELLEGKSAVLVDDTAQYLQNRYAEQEYRYTKGYVSDRAYWVEHARVGEAGSLSVRPTSVPSGEAIRVRQPLPEALVRALRGQAGTLEVSFHRLMVAAAMLFLHKASGQRELCIGLPTHGRFDAASRDLIAARTNISPIRSVADAQASLAEFVRASVVELRESLQHGRFGYEEIRRLLAVRSDVPLYRLTVNVLPNHLQRTDLGTAYGDMRWFPRYENDLILWVFLAVDREDVAIQLDGNPHLYREWELAGHLERFEDFLAALAQAPADAAVGKLGVLSASQRHRVLWEFNATAVTYPQADQLPQLFEAQVARAGEAVALVHEAGVLGYRELNERANQLARYLRARAVGPGSVVGICADRSPEMLIALLGVMKAGGAYVPVDPGLPRERLGYMLQEAQARVVLTQGKHAGLLSEAAVQWLALDEAGSALQKYSRSDLPAREVGLGGEDLAYVIYTSGSTGRPKGAGVRHAGMRNLLQWYTQEFGFGASDRTLIVSSFGFDLTQKNFLAGLLAGGEVHLAAEPFDAQGIVAQIERAGITRMNLTPSAFYAIVEADGGRGGLKSLRSVFLGGEPISVSRLSALAVYGTLEVVNSYGPTECTDVVAFHRLAGQWWQEAEAVVPIGRPISNARLYVLDEAGEPVAVGMAGEICIGGICVGAGYIGEAALTAQRFVADRFGEEGSSEGNIDERGRLYKTGDVGRWLPDGSIEYLGRNDHQVKVRGYRIELGEIESQLSRHPQVKEAVVVARDEGGEKRLVGYVTPVDGAPLTHEALRAHLQGSVPEYMIPTAFVPLSSLPLTPNGKVDRQALPAPDAQLLARAYEAPQGALEETLASIWQELLHVERIGRHDNFFELGGHSLLLARVALWANDALHVEVPIPMLFECPSVALLATRIESLRWMSQAARQDPAVEFDREVGFL